VLGDQRVLDDPVTARAMAGVAVREAVDNGGSR
jgi:pyruvate/2-oxoglutarate/acetoin dehydrogenase E1 component